MPDGEVAFHRHDIALGIGINGEEFLLLFLALGAAVPCGIITHAPGTDVKARAQVDVLAAVILFTLLACVALAGGRAVIEQPCGDPFVELFWVDIAAWNLAQGQLWNTEQQLLIANVKRSGCRRDGV